MLSQHVGTGPWERIGWYTGTGPWERIGWYTGTEPWDWLGCFMCINRAHFFCEIIHIE